MKVILLLLLLDGSFCLQSQTLDKTLSITQNQDSLSVSIKFLQESVAENLLIVISDTNGSTIFLDNKKNYSGHYNRSVDLSSACPGFCTIRISTEVERYEYKVKRRP